MSATEPAAQHWLGQGWEEGRWTEFNSTLISLCKLLNMEEHPWKAHRFREELLLTLAIDWKQAQNFSWLQEQISPHCCLLEGLSIFPVKGSASHHFNNLTVNLKPFREDVYQWPQVGAAWVKSPNGPSSSLFYIFNGATQRYLSAIVTGGACPILLIPPFPSPFFLEHQGPLTTGLPDATPHSDLTSTGGRADGNFFFLESSKFTCLVSQFFRFLGHDSSLLN